jgi:hypothetical protein
MGGNFQRVIDTDGTNPQSLDSQAEILRRAGWRGKVEDVVDRAGIKWLAYVPLFKAKARIIGQVREVFPVSGAEVIDADDGVALAQQTVGEMRTEKPGCAGDKYVHGQ